MIFFDQFLLKMKPLHVPYELLFPTPCRREITSSPTLWRCCMVLFVIEIEIVILWKCAEATVLKALLKVTVKTAVW